MLVANGSADVTTYFVLRDSTNHAPKTDVTITDIDLYYVEERAAISTKADATALAAADSAHGDNQAFHVGQGLYRIDWPDAAFDGGVGKKVNLIVVCTGVDTTFQEVELSPPVNVVAVGGTTQTARDLGASVLLSPGTGTGQISLTSGQVTIGTNNDKTGYTASTVSDKTGYSLAADQAVNVTKVNGTAQTAGDLAALITAVDDYVDSEVGALTTELAKVPKSDGTATWNATALASIQAEATDALNAYDPPTKDELDTAQGAVTLANVAHGGAAATLTLSGAAGLVATKIDAAINGAITGNITGNLSGSVGSVTGAVGSVTGAVGSVTGAVGSVTGNVGGNVVGSVASVTGAVGSVTGAVGSVTGNVGGNVTGSVGSVATGGITAASIADAAIDIATFAADCKTGTYINAQVKAQDNIDFGALQKASLNAATPASVLGAVGSVTGNVTGSVGSVASGGITATSIATGAIDADALATDAAAEIADAIFDEALAGHTSAGTFGKLANNLNPAAGQMVTGSVDSATLSPTTTAFETSLTEQTADHYNGRSIIFTSGALVGQASSVTDYEYTANSKGKLTVTALTEAPANTDTFVLV